MYFSAATQLEQYHSVISALLIHPMCCRYLKEWLCMYSHWNKREGQISMSVEFRGCSFDYIDFTHSLTLPSYWQFVLNREMHAMAIWLTGLAQEAKWLFSKSALLISIVSMEQCCNLGTIYLHYSKRVWIYIKEQSECSFWENSHKPEMT